MQIFSEKEQNQEVQTILYGLEFFGQVMTERMEGVISSWQNDKKLLGIDQVFTQLEFYEFLLKQIKNYPAYHDYMKNDVGENTK